MSLNTIFLILISIYLIITIYYGTRRAMKQDEGTVKDWFAGGGKIAFVVVGFTMASAWLDMATLYLHTGQGYVVGISAYWFLAGAEMSAFVVCAFLFAKRIRNTNMISQGEMVERRFTPALRPLFAFIWVLSLSGYAGLSFLVFNEFLQFMFGIDQLVAAFICMAVVIAFQWVGGYTATVYADYIQAGLIIIGTVIMGIFAVNAAGGMEVITATVPPHFLSFFGIGIDRVFMITIPLIFAFIIEPTLWLRLVSARSVKDAKRASFIAFLVFVPVCVSTLLAGLASYVLYPTWDLSLNMIAVDMAVRLFPTMITAIIFVAIIAALFSSFNAFMTAANANLCYDLIPYIYKKMNKREFPENKYRFISRIGMIGIAILGTFIALWLPNLTDILLFSGSLAAAAMFLPVFAMFFLNKVNTTGAVCSFVLGSASQLVLFIWNNVTGAGIEPFFISFPLAIVGLIVGTAIGKNKPPTAEQLEPFIIKPGSED